MPIPPLEFLFDASKRSLEDAELAELNRSTNLSKAIRVELAAQIEAEATALMIRWMLEHREELLARREIDVQPKKADLFGVENRKRA